MAADHVAPFRMSKAARNTVKMRSGPNRGTAASHALRFGKEPRAGLFADHYDNGSCKVNADPASGKADEAAGKQLEGVLNEYDKAVNSLVDSALCRMRHSAVSSNI